MTETFYQLETSLDRFLLEDNSGLLVIEFAPPPGNIPFIPPNVIVRLSGTGAMQVRKSS